MQSWLRAVVSLALPFVIVVGVTLGLAEIIVGRTPTSAADPGASPTDGAAGPVAPRDGGPVTAVGGTLTVSGDRDTPFVLDREALDQGYALAGELGRIYLGGDPLGVERVSYDGLEFYVDEGDCSLTPGERHDPTGVAGAEIRCEDIDDIRDGGTVSMEGTVGVSADVLGLRGDMPPTGGTISIGETELELPFAAFFTGRPIDFAPAGFLSADDGSAWLMFQYDFQLHALVLEAVFFDNVETEIDDGACSIATDPIGTLNPRTTTAEMTIECPAVELENGETVAIRGTLIADLIENP